MKKIRTANQHGVIYAFICKNCEGEYIGQTGQKLKIRINQHKKDITTNKPKKNKTAAFQHAKETDFANTRILSKAHNLQKRLILDSINIHVNKRHPLNLKSDLLRCP